MKGIVAQETPRKRVSKPPEVRREELLDAAEALSREMGFEDMPVEAVTSRAGVAKGTFYLYFSSKSDLLEQLMQRYSATLMEQLFEVLKSVEGASALERLQTFWVKAAQYKESYNAAAFADVLFDDGNGTLRARTFQMWADSFGEMVLGIVRDGKADGSFDIEDPEMVADIIISIWFDAATRLWTRVRKLSGQALVDAFISGIKEYCHAHDRLLGVPDGSFDVLSQIDAAGILKDFDGKYRHGRQS
ncbi:MAG: TetR/AcrR family transcriptional regulator [Propionibacteriaceae bacterium]|jgi:AcrR family transcriptional regulator|nr:TetR/AcrR family transcriptional regulator [Propionibacteriaceae bacterium]